LDSFREKESRGEEGHVRLGLQTSISQLRVLGVAEHTIRREERVGGGEGKGGHAGECGAVRRAQRTRTESAVSIVGGSENRRKKKTKVILGERGPAEDQRKRCCAANNKKN